METADSTNTASTSTSSTASTSTSTARTTTTHPGTPVGTWREELLLDRGTYTSTIRFVRNGRALLLAGPRPGCVGAGSWAVTGPGRFTFRLAELVFDPDGTFTGWVDIEQHAVLDGDAFTSSGTSHVYDAEDRLLERAGVKARAARTGGGTADAAEGPSAEGPSAV